MVNYLIKLSDHLILTIILLQIRKKYLNQKLNLKFTLNYFKFNLILKIIINQSISDLFKWMILNNLKNCKINGSLSDILKISIKKLLPNSLIALSQKQLLNTHKQSNKNKIF